MIRRTIAAAIAVLLSVSLAACAAPQKKRYEASFLTLFDTVTTIVAYSDSEEIFRGQAQYIHDQLEVYHQLYDIYNDYEGVNNIRTINEQAGIAPVKVDRKIIDMLLLAKEMDRETDGLINVAMGSVLSVWHDYREAGIDDPEHAELPPMAELQAAAEHTDINQVIIDEEASTVFLKDPEMSLDVGSIGKGYATEMVCQMAIENGFDAGLVSVGGNVRAIGKKQGKTGEPWNVGIQNPDMGSDKKLIQTVNLEDVSLVTSGDYQRYYTVDGKNYHHIIEPDSLMPSPYFHAVSIICKDSGRADALSTAVFNMPLEEGQAFVESLPGVEAMWALLDGSEQFSSGFSAYLKK